MSAADRPTTDPVEATASTGSPAHLDRRLVAATVVALVVLVALLVAATWSWQPPLVEDLRVYRDGVLRLVHGTALYPPGSYYAAGQPLPFTYPPLAALVLLPLAWVPLGPAVALWWATSFGCLLWLVHRGFAPLLSQLPGAIGRASATVLLAMACAAALGPIYYVFGFGQVGLFLGALCLLDLDLGSGRSRLAGAFLGLAGAIKLIPLGFALAYVAARRWRAVATVAVVFLACTALSALLLPGDLTDYLGVAGDPNRVGPVDGVVNVSWHGLWLRLLGPGTPATIAWLVCAALTLVVAARRSAFALRDQDPVLAVTLMGLATVLASPVSWMHHNIWVVPLIGIVLGTGRSWRRWLLALAVAAVFSLPATSFVVRDPSDAPFVGPWDWWHVNAVILVSMAAVLWLRREPSPAPHRRTSREAAAALAP